MSETIVQRSSSTSPPTVTSSTASGETAVGGKRSPATGQRSVGTTRSGSSGSSRTYCRVAARARPAQRNLRCCSPDPEPSAATFCNDKVAEATRADRGSTVASRMWSIGMSDHNHDDDRRKAVTGCCLHEVLGCLPIVLSISALSVHLGRRWLYRSDRTTTTKRWVVDNKWR